MSHGDWLERKPPEEYEIIVARGGWHRNRRNFHYHLDHHQYFITSPRFMTIALHEKLKEGFTAVQRRIDHYVTINGYCISYTHNIPWPRLAKYYSLRTLYKTTMEYMCTLIGSASNVELVNRKLQEIAELEDEIYGKSFSAWEFVRNLFTGRCG